MMTTIWRQALGRLGMGQSGTLDYEQRQRLKGRLNHWAKGFAAAALIFGLGGLSLVWGGIALLLTAAAVTVEHYS